MRRPALDLATLVIAVVIAAAARVEGLVGLVLAYGAAWLAVNVATVRGWPPSELRVPVPVAVMLVLVVVAVPSRDLATRTTTIVEHEALSSPLEHLADRLALETGPAIAPSLVSTDRPQTFFVRAAGARVRVRFGAGLPWLEAEGMGHGVFRLDYDPRGAEVPSGHATEATIEVDGQPSPRTLRVASPAPHPRWPRRSANGTRACIPSEETDEVVIVALDAEPERVETYDAPTDCVIADDGTMFVAHRHAGRIMHRSRAGRTVDIDVGGSASALALLDERPCIARDGEVRCFGPHPLRAHVEGTPLFLAGVPGEAALVLATRSPASLVRLERDGETLGVRTVHPLTTPPAFLVVEGPRVVVALSDRDDAGLGNHFVQDRIATFDARTLALLEDRPTAYRTERQDHAGDVDRGASPMGIAPTTRGTTWVAFAGTDEIEELGGPAPRVIDTAPFGASAPFGVVELADGAIVVTSPSSGLVIVLEPDGRVRARVALAPSDRELLAEDPDALQLRYGERAFYEATRSGVSCQSCHLHGGTDGAVHNIGGRVLAPTLDVRGLIGTSPYLRDGSYPRLRDLHEVAVTEYRGYRESAGDRGANVEAWLRTLPPPPTFVRREPALEREGLDVFFRAGCPDCHAAPAFTSLGLHAVDAVFPGEHGRGEGRLLDVPSLRSLAVSAPYLYDGRAATLRAVLTDQNPGDRHGHTRHLDPPALDALEAFLRSL